MKQGPAACLAIGWILLVMSIPVMIWWIPLAFVVQNASSITQSQIILAQEGLLAVFGLYVLSGLFLFWGFQEAFPDKI